MRKKLRRTNRWVFQYGQKNKTKNWLSRVNLILPVCRSVRPSVGQSVCLSVGQFVCLSASPSICRAVFLFLSQSVWRPIYLTVCLVSMLYYLSICWSDCLCLFVLFMILQLTSQIRGLCMFSLKCVTDCAYSRSHSNDISHRYQFKTV